MNPVIASLALLAAPELPAMHPAGDWLVAPAGRACVAQQDFGTAIRPTVFALRQVPLGTTIEVRLSLDEPGYVSRMDNGKLILAPSLRTVPVHVISFGPVTDNRRILQFTVADVPFAELVSADGITVERGHAGAPVSLALGPVKGVIPAMASCSDEVLRRQGLDPIALHRLSRQPTPVGGAETKWFSSSDYPNSARGNFRSGRTVALITVGADGRVSGCKVAESAGNPDLDAKTCAVLVARGRYDPGLDAGGHPVSAQKLVGVSWAMPPLFFRR